MAFVKNWLENAEQSVNEELNQSINPTLDEFDSIVGSAQSELRDVSEFLNAFNNSLPVYKNAHAAIHNWEPVYLNQFDVVITPPRAISSKNSMYTDILIEHVKDVQGLPEIIPTAIVEQKYMWVTRTFSKPVPETSTADLTIDFEVNLNNRNTMYVYEMLRMWAESSFSPEFNFHGTRRDYLGEMTVIVHNKMRRAFRTFNFKAVFLTNPFNSMELAYLSDDIYVLSATFRSDGWTEKRNRLSLTY